MAVVWLLEPEDEPEALEGVPDEFPEALPVPPLGFDFEPVCEGGSNEVMAGEEPGEGAV